MATTEPGAPSRGRAPRLPAWLRTLLAHTLTATVAVLLSLTLGTALRPTVPIPTPPPPPTPTPRPTAVPTPAPTPAPLDANIARQELADLSAEIDQLWTVSYLSRALIYLSEAESALRNNDWQTVSQALIAVDDSLLLSYGRADESIKSPIEQIRVEIDRTRNDLYLRPEGMDARLGGLRQTILALVEARR